MKYKNFRYLLVVALFSGFLLESCQSGEKNQKSALSWDSVQDTTQRVLTITGGLKGPETVLYDQDQDVYFISNYNGSGMAADSNGFISKVQPDGTMDALKFMTGTEEYPFHSGHGMAENGDTLFVADRDGVHGFNRLTGKHVSYIDFSTFDHGFLNDIALGPDGALYVTDTNRKKPTLYRISGGKVTIETDSLPVPPNGIAFDTKTKKLVIDPFQKGENTFLTWDPMNHVQGTAGQGLTSLYDGIKFVGDNFIVSSQADSTLQIIRNGKGTTFVKVAGAPANIAYDSKRRRVAVPYVALNRVDIWQLPKE